jgi:hypothetical protein
MRTAVLEFRDHVHAGKAGVAALVGIEGRDAHQPVHPALGLGEAVGVFAPQHQGSVFDARPLTGQGVGDLDLPPARFGPALVHAQQHGRPVAGLGAPGPGVDAQDGIVAVMRAVEKESQFQRLQPVGKCRAVPFQLGGQRGLGRLGFGPGQFEHERQVLELLFGGPQGVKLAADAVGLVNQALGRLAIAPKVVPGHFRLDFAEAFLQRGHVKETSATASVSRGWRRVGSESRRTSRRSVVLPAGTGQCF